MINKLNKICPTCNRIFLVWKCEFKTRKFCSYKCVRHTDEWKKKASESKLNSKNPMWKGNNAGYDAIHIWVAKRYPKKEFCEMCNKVPPFDLANISDKPNKKTYNRDLKNWKWLCHKCHMIEDGRLENFLKKRFIPEVKKPVKCKICKLVKKNKRYGLCVKCSDRVRYYTTRRNYQTVSNIKGVPFVEAVKIVRNKLS